MWSRVVMSQVKHKSFFIVGMALGLWVSLAAIPLEEESAAACGALAAADEFEPQRQDKPRAPPVAARALARPRYYTTELGMRGSLLTAVLSSEAELAGQVAALNATLAALQPAVKFFIAASAAAAPPRANVVAFTDTREMLKPFHALKYLADNYLEEYDFFYLVSDETFVDARRLAALAARLSVSGDLYLGEAAPGSAYCALDAGMLLSNSVLRAVHAQLDWCVRNSYSPHHHENIGRCVLHAAGAACAPAAQGQRYRAARLPADGADGEAAALGAHAARPARGARLLRLAARAARAHLAAARARAGELRAYMWRSAGRHPPHYRNSSWPAGLRAEPGLAPPPPADRHSHARWTPFNATHALLADERAAAALGAAHGAALALVAQTAGAWARRRWPGAAAAVLEGAWRWEPATALRYRLLLRLTPPDAPPALRLVEVVRGVGAARLVPVRYVTEAAPVALVLPLRRAAPLPRAAPNTRLYLAPADNATRAALEPAAAAAGARLLPAAPAPAAAPPHAAAGAALAAAARAAPPHELLLLLPPHLDFDNDFLNRVRMNTIQGAQWFSPLPFARALHPRGGAAGRFRARPAGIIAVYRDDYDRAMAAWRGEWWDAEGALAASPLAVVRAPDPGAVLAAGPGEGPCGAEGPAAGPGECARRLLAAGPELGARTALAQLLLETMAARD